MCTDSKYTLLYLDIKGNADQRKLSFRLREEWKRVEIGIKLFWMECGAYEMRYDEY